MVESSVRIINKVSVPEVYGSSEYITQDSLAIIASSLDRIADYLEVLIERENISQPDA